METSQILECDVNSRFGDIKRMSQKATYVVVKMPKSGFWIVRKLDIYVFNLIHK
jgi:hypothetical protein